MYSFWRQSTSPKVPVIRTFEDLRQHKNWVCYDRDGDGLSSVTRQWEDGTDPQAWDTYENAHQYFRDHYPSALIGVGFMLTPEFGVTLMEVHDCLDDGMLNPVAKELVEQFDTSYIEIINHKTGLRIWVQDLLHEPISFEDEEEREEYLAEHPARLVKVSNDEWGKY